MIIILISRIGISRSLREAVDQSVLSVPNFPPCSHLRFPAELKTGIITELTAGTQPGKLVIRKKNTLQLHVSLTDKCHRTQVFTHNLYTHCIWKGQFSRCYHTSPLSLIVFQPFTVVCKHLDLWTYISHLNLCLVKLTFLGLKLALLYLYSLRAIFYY